MCACYKWQILVSISMQQSTVKTCLCERRPDYRPNEWKLHSLTLLFYRSLCGLWLRYKLNRRAIHSNYSDSQCFRTPKWLNCQHNLRVIAFSWMSCHVWRTNVIMNQVGLMAGFHFQPFHVCFVGKSKSLPLCLYTVVRVVERRTGFIMASQLFCSMLGEPDIQREEKVADTFQRCQICVREIKASPSLFICPCHLVGERGARGVPPAVSPLEKSEGGGF